MYERILVAIDGSNSGEKALKEATALAVAHGAALRIAYAVDEVPPYFSGDTNVVDVREVDEALQQAGARLLETARATAQAAGLAPETVLLHADSPGRRIAELIAEEAGRWPADLIVAGTHGRRGLSHLFLGSVAEGIVRNSPVPVLLVRGR